MNEERVEDGKPPNPSNSQIHFQLDHFLTQKQNLKRVLNAKQVGDGAPSDHMAIKRVICITMSLVKKKSRVNTRSEKKKKRKKLDWRLLQNKDIRAKYNGALRTILEKEAGEKWKRQSSNFMNATLQGFPRSAVCNVSIESCQPPSSVTWQDEISRYSVSSFNR
eukprot:scaffold203831_cov60-Attheya_sp.AAC.1